MEDGKGLLTPTPTPTFTTVSSMSMFLSLPQTAQVILISKPTPNLNTHSPPFLLFSVRPRTPPRKGQHYQPRFDGNHPAPILSDQARSHNVPDPHYRSPASLFTSAIDDYRHINPGIAHQPQRSVYCERFVVPLLTLSEGSSLPCAVPYTGPQECSASSPHVSNPSPPSYQALSSLSPPSYQALSSLSPFHPTASNVQLTPLLFIFSRHRSFRHLVAPSNDKWAEHHLHPCFKLDVAGVLDIAPLPPPLLNTGISKTNAEPLGANATSSPFLRPCSHSCPNSGRDS